MADFTITWDHGAIEGLVRRDDVQAEARRKAHRMVNVAQNLVRVDTGELRDSVRVIDESGGTFLVGTDNDHAEPNEFGTSRMPAQPFIRPLFTRGIT